MKHLLLTALAVALVFVVQTSNAQEEWQSTGVFWPAELELNQNGNGGHGLAVDPDGKIWFHFFSATDSVQVPELGDTWQPVRVLYAYNPDGSAALFSPIKFLGPNCDSDTLGGEFVGGAWSGKSGRGLSADQNGNILVSEFDRLYRINYQTGECMNKAFPFEDLVGTANTTLARVSADNSGKVYAGRVFPGGPIRVLNEDLTSAGENVTDLQSQFSRSHQVNPGGDRFYETDYENTYTIIHEKPDEFSPWDSVDVAFRGMRSESSSFNPATGHIWVSSGNPLNLVNEDPTVVTNWVSQSWYSFDPADLTTPLAFFTWDNSLAADDTGRPRGLGFSPDGMTAYVTMFSTGGAAIQSFSPGAVGVEPVDSEIPESFSLKQNYPNPFNPTTTIEFDLRTASMAQLRVYDVLGREVAELVNEPLAAGTYKVQFDASELSSGTYVYVLETESARQSASMTILK